MMTGSDLAVVAAAVAAIGLVNWYFLFGRGSVAATAMKPADGPQTVTVEVRGGYTPDVIEVERGRPVRLTFNRQETNPCSEEVVLPAFGIRRALPAGAETVVEFEPLESGRFEFTCGMGMLRGAIVVK
jgi:plastocyanin domain-containing protein